ncbi:Maf family protein [Fervidobacterium sp.]
MIVLGSSSPRRIQLLSLLGLPFEVVKPDVDEEIANEKIYNPEVVVTELAKLKCEAVFNKLISDQDGYHFRLNEVDAIITADTVVWLDGEILGKPANKNEAEKMLRKLSGNWHKVFTGVCVKIPGEEITFFEETQVKFKELSDWEISYYISTGEPLDKAGAYGIQGLGGVFIEKIIGDYTNVVGLPIPKLWQVLLDRGVIKKYATRKWSQGEIT